MAGFLALVRGLLSVLLNSTNVVENWAPEAVNFTINTVTAGGLRLGVKRKLSNDDIATIVEMAEQGFFGRALHSRFPSVSKARIHQVIRQSKLPKRISLKERERDAAFQRIEQ